MLWYIVTTVPGPDAWIRVFGEVLQEMGVVDKPALYDAYTIRHLKAIGIAVACSHNIILVSPLLNLKRDDPICTYK